jgi:hypothetical protein
MKVLVFELHHPAPVSLLDDDRLANVRLLMEAGFYGLLEGPGTAVAAAIRDEFARAGWRITDVDSSSLAGSAEIRPALVCDDWDLLLVAASADDDPAFDEELGGLLGLVDGETAILIVSTPGAFVLAGPGVPPLGEVEGARPIDLAPTLLALAGLDLPAATPGRPLFAAAEVHAPPSRDDADPAVLERLSGLGYI